MSTELDQKMVDVQDEGPVEDSTAIKVTDMTPNQMLEAYRAAVSEHQLSIRASARIGIKAIGWMSVIGLVSLQEVEGPKV